ncbi:TonB-dependent receptor [Thioalkalivibrio thiocyanodenitrificans]|uniref:TonB-dependent receptor n=1 Tax=Thioalkalivibrio thiocyanodenitrificans TaxID=243063 RepID=UPI0003803D13|nr:TonB-dependent receptor [Thioalkalivibrio thiocyanodenitrificans]
MHATLKDISPYPASRLCASAAGVLLLAYAGCAWSETNALQTIVVSGSAIEDRFEAGLHDPSSSTVISGEQIDEQRATNIIDVLRAVPGLTADLRGGEDGTKIRLRGIDNQRFMSEKPGVAIIIDGVPVFERTGRVNIDLDNIESIRVIKGGASYLYGEDALSGAVVITTKRGARHEGVTAEHDRGSFGYQRWHVKGGWLSDNFGGHLQYSDRQTDGYYALSERYAKTLAGNFQWFIDDRSDLTFGFERSDRYRDREGSVTGVTNARLDPKGEEQGRGRTRHFEIDLQRLNLTYANHFSPTGNLLAIAYQYDDQTDFWVAPIRFDADGNFVDDSQVDAYQRSTDYEQQQRGMKLEARESFGRWGLMGGAELKRNTFDEISVVREDYRNSPVGPVIEAGTVMSDGYREETTHALYAETRVGLGEATTATANYRLDRIRLEDEDRLAGIERDKTLTVHSWRIGGDHQLSPVTSLYGGISTGFRAPTLEELSTNPDLDPEHTRNYEIGLRTDVDLLGWPTQLNSSIFHIRRKDYIVSNIGQYVNAKAADEVYFDNIGDVASQGLELALRTDVRHQLAFDLAYTYLDSYFKRYDEYYMALGNMIGGTPVDSLEELTDPNTQVYFQPYDNKGNKVPRTPSHTINFRTHWHPAPAWRFTTEIDYRGESYADEINQEKLPSRTLLNMMLAYNSRVRLFGGKASTVRAYLKVDNVLDDQYFLIARGFYDTNRDGVYDGEDLSIVVDPGRVWTAGLSVSF